jgi:hypothetical protein
MDRGTSTNGGGGIPESVELPAPTASPIVLAFGVTLLFAGLATTALITAIGAVLSVAGLVGWIRDLFPVQQTERVPVVAEVIRISSDRREIERVNAAPQLVRANLPIEFYPVSAGVRGGLWGGVAMAVLAAAYGIASGHGVWYPINLLAAVFFPSMATATTAEISAFNALALAAATGIHLFASLLVGVAYGAMSPMLPRRPILLGGLIAPLLWTGLLHSTLAWINPVLASRIDWRWFVLSQIGFGVVAGLVVSRRQRVSTAQPMPFLVRAGIEATGLEHTPPGEGTGT